MYLSSLSTFVIIGWFIIGLQVIYLTCFLVAFSRKATPACEQDVPVSVIVCAHDEEKNLKELLPLLLRQDYPSFEVIVVEDRCNDDTYDYLLAATKADSRLKMVRVQHLPHHINGKKFALTLGIRAAANDWVLLTDADCRPASERWIASAAAHFHKERQIVLGFSPYIRERGYLNAFVRFESLLTGIQFIGWALLGRPYMGMGRNLAYRKSLFLDSKGFHKYLGVTGGDDDLFINEHATSTNTGINIGAETLMLSVPKKSWKDFYFQKLRHLSVGKKYKWSDKMLLALFSATWILCWMLVFPLMLLPAAAGAFLWLGFLVREALLVIVIHRASRVLGDSFETWKTPLLDFNYAIYYLGTGLVALTSKRVRWKN